VAAAVGSVARAATGLGTAVCGALQARLAPAQRRRAIGPRTLICSLRYNQWRPAVPAGDSVDRLYKNLVNFLVGCLSRR